MDKLSYSLGLGIGRQLLQLGAKDLNVDDFAQSIRDILAGKKPAVSDEEAQQIVNNFFREQKRRKPQRQKPRARTSSRRTRQRRVSSHFLQDCSTRCSAKATERSLQQRMLWSATTRAHSSMVRSSTPATVGESTLHSPSTRLLKDGQRVCSS